MIASWRMVSARCDAGAAVAIVELAGDVESALAALGIAPVPIGRIALRDLGGIDEGLVARWSAKFATLTPHGGPHLVARLADALVAAGLSHAPAAPDDAELLHRYPEAADLVEARMLQALAQAASPLAIDLLLDQPRRWRTGAPSEPGLDRVLARLLSPPLVVALGPANIGKSTLLNALAGRAAAIVADEPGTTRDFVGVRLDLDGLVVRYADTPGLRDGGGAVEAEARSIALDLARGADLLLLCGDAVSPPPHPAALGLYAPALTVALRADLGPPPFSADAVVAARRGEGVADLAARVRGALLPRSALESPLPWKFWAD